MPTRPAPSRRARTLSVLATAAFVTITVAACGSSNSSDKAFCAMVTDAAPALTGQITTDEQLDGAIARYTTLQAKAPSEIADDLKVLTDTWKLRKQLDMTKPEDRNRLIAIVFSQPYKTASDNFQTWVKSSCALDLSPSQNVGGPPSSVALPGAGGSDAGTPTTATGAGSPTTGTTPGATTTVAKTSATTAKNAGTVKGTIPTATTK